MTKEGFEQYYADNTGITITDLVTLIDRAAIPCHCDYEECQGWQMVRVAEAKEYYATHEELE